MDAAQTAKPTKRTLLAQLSKKELVDIGRWFELPILPGTPEQQALDIVIAAEPVTLEKILPRLERATLKDLCKGFALPFDGGKKEVLVARLLTAAAPSGVSPAQQTLAIDDHVLELEVPPKKPRLAWQGMARKEAVAAVPTQIVEIVRPRLARERGALLDADLGTTTGDRDDTLPPNRLIWTNDNLVALKTLLDERDPATKAYRYRGKVDLVYIDPPFMVNNDFRADNSIDIDLDEDEGVQAKKEPSLVEHLAYRDTWRQGLDSFLSMLKRRLELLKDLLAPTGSIYVHLDWHAVHYVKVMMDEVFGYENFVNEIIWKRTSAHNMATKGFARSHDTILFYGGAAGFVLEPQYADYGEAQLGRYQLDEAGQLYKAENLTFSSRTPSRQFTWRGTRPPEHRSWGASLDQLERWWQEGRILCKKDGTPRLDGLKVLLSEMKGNPVSTLWTDIERIGNTSAERLGYPTQKPATLLERIVVASSPPGGLVLDCFAGSGTTAEAAERLGRRWIGIDNGKYAVHLARKRLIQLHGQPTHPERSRYEYVECATCKNIERKEKPQTSREVVQVSAFTVENMGVYQTAEAWQDFQIRKSRYRDEMIKVFGGEPLPISAYLHGKIPHDHGKALTDWIHVGALDGAISVSQMWTIARDAQRLGGGAVTVLSADFDTLSGAEKEQIFAKTGVRITIRVIPMQAIDEVRRRVELTEVRGEKAVESMAIPAFYAPLSIVLNVATKGRIATLTLDRCEIDVQSFLTSQRPILKPITEKLSASARKRAEDEHKKWADRKADLEVWLAKAKSWQKFIDFWAVDWDYDRRTGPDGKPIFETDWQSFPVRRGKNEVQPLVFTAETQYAQPGVYRVAAKVTDVFGNDGIATVACAIE